MTKPRFVAEGECRALPEKVRTALPGRVLKESLKIGVALSGGADSVALLASLCQLGCECMALHCNFQLRGEESERDERFVRQLCGDLGVPLRCVRFDVHARCRATGESVEMACRALRYDWFAETAREEGLRYVAVAHHREDNVETFFLNLLRGSGLNGLVGMWRERDLYIRPLLDVTRSEIEEYLSCRGLGFVTDSTNLLCDFKRNRLRNRVLPVLEENFPGAVADVARSQQYLADDLQLLDRLLAEAKKKYFITGESYGRKHLEIDLAELTGDYGAVSAQLLFRALKTDFPELQREMAEDMVKSCLQGNSGRFFSVGKQRFLLDRGHISLVAADASDEDEIYPIDPARPETYGQFFEISEIAPGEFRPSRNPNEMWVDADLLSRAKLYLRAPRKGDRLAPFGMKGTRLLSDIFSDAKLSVVEKAAVRVLVAVEDTAENGDLNCSASHATGKEKILWVCGIRSSRHFPVTGSTERILRFTYRP